MKVFVSLVTDPWVNMGLESFFLNHYQEEGCLIYRDAPCLVIGKNQNPYREVNITFCKEKALPVIRRISGGGTVYHDLGNLNTAFFGERRGIADNLYERWSEPLIEFLSSLGLLAVRDGRNGLELAGKKISGSAQALKRKRFLHHATLLYSSDLQSLSNSIDTLGEGVTGGGIPSHKSPVTNVEDHLRASLSIDEFMTQWIGFLLNRFGQSGVTEIPAISAPVVEELVVDQFKSWEWLMGRTPRFHFELPTLRQPIRFLVFKGMIETIDLTGDFGEANESLNALIGQRFDYQTLAATGLGSFCPNLAAQLF